MADLRSVVDDYPSTVGICLDTGHANNNGLDPAERGPYRGERLIALHMQDTDAVEDRHWPPGLGNIDWRRVSAALIEIGFNGAWTFDSAPARPVRRLRLPWRVESPTPGRRDAPRQNSRIPKPPPASTRSSSIRAWSTRAGGSPRVCRRYACRSAAASR